MLCSLHCQEWGGGVEAAFCLLGGGVSSYSMSCFLIENVIIKSDRSLVQSSSSKISTVLINGENARYFPGGGKPHNPQKPQYFDRYFI